MAIELLQDFSIKLNGSDASAQFNQDVYAITVDTSLHLPSVATILLYDTQLSWIDADSVYPGTTVKIWLGDTSASTPLFDGEVVEVEPEFSGQQQFLTIRAFDRLHRLSRGKFVKTFQNVKDSDLVSQIAGTVGLTADATATSEVYDHVWQSNQTNLEFLQTRAARNGYLLFVQEQKLCFKPPPSGSSVATLAWHVDLAEFRPRLSTVDQINGVTVRGWDPKQKQAIVGQATTGNGQPSIGISDKGGSYAENAYSGTYPGLITNQPVPSQSAANTLAQSHADQRASRFIQAEGKCVGRPTVIAGAKITVNNVGTKFSGDYLVTNATHHLGSGYYFTDFTVSGYDTPALAGIAHPVPELIPIRGPSVGIVTDNNDPNGEGRVKVKFPSLSDSDASFWAPIVSQGAGANRGIEFIPEVNDEVLVAFEHGDINYPYVLGGLWNGVDSPPKASSDAVSSNQVNLRYIQSRVGHMIFLDDGPDGGITIQDKDGDKVVLQTGKSITIQDKAGNKIVLDVNGQSITVEAMQNLTLKGTNAVKIQGMTVDIQGETSASVKGLSLSLEGTASLSAKGADVSVTGDATVGMTAPLIKLN